MASRGEESALSHRAEVFRSKLIEDFQILECISEQGREKVPIYNSSDITKSGILDKVLLERPEQMVKFKVYKRDKLPDMMANVDRRLTRVKNQSRLPLGVWANWIVEGEPFQRFLMALIVINSVSIGVQGELPLSSNRGLHVLTEVLDFIDAVTVIVFSMEIVLKWIDNFKYFWRNQWNVFDLAVTVLSAVPHIMILFAGDNAPTIAAVAEHLAVFRILRALKMVARFGRLRIIVLTVLQAFQSMAFITILLFTVAYIFAIVGVIFFESYTTSDRDDLSFRSSFSSLPNALITLFQLFTLDQWYKIYNDLTKVSSMAFTCTYIILWVWIGSFVFRNLFVGIMVNNFQNITAELVRKQETQEQCEELARMKEELNLELTRHDARMEKARKSIVVPPSGNSGTSMDSGEHTSTAGQDLKEQVSQMMQEEEEISEGWDKTVHAHLMALASNPVETLWPRDILFKYFQRMEQLQENLEEYDKLQKLINGCLLEIHDDD